MCTPYLPDPASVDALPPSRASFSARCGYRRCLRHSRGPRFRRARACARVFLRPFYLFCSARTAGLLDNRSASILIQTATKTIPSTRRSRKIMPIAVIYRLCGTCKVLSYFQDLNEYFARTIQLSPAYEIFHFTLERLTYLKIHTFAFVMLE